MKFEVRPAVAEDLASVLSLYNRAHPEEAPSSVEILAWSLARADPSRPRAHLVAVLDKGVVGNGYIRAIPEMESLVLNIEVGPDYRRRGLGTELLARLLEVTGDEPRVMMAVSEASVSGIAFAEHRGFREHSRRYESELNLETFDPALFAEGREVLDKSGIRFATLGDEDSPQFRRSLYQLAEQVRRDVPTPEPMPPTTYEEWERDWLDVPFASPATFAIALVRDRPIALSYLVLEADGSGYNWVTGVARTYRRRGLGLAIKVEALRLAKNLGVPFVRTHNDLTNVPMLAVNKRLGFQSRPGVIGFERVLKSG